MNPRAHQLVEELQKLQTDVVNDAGRNQTRQSAFMAELFVVLAEEQERLAIQSEKTTQENLKLQAKVVKLTWALFWLTFMLTIVASIQVYFIFLDRP